VGALWVFRVIVGIVAVFGLYSWILGIVRAILYTAYIRRDT
jgi:hypothetical protein